MHTKRMWSPLCRPAFEQFLLHCLVQYYIQWGWSNTTLLSIGTEYLFFCFWSSPWVLYLNHIILYNHPIQLDVWMQHSPLTDIHDSLQAHQWVDPTFCMHESNTLTILSFVLHLNKRQVVLTCYQPHHPAVDHWTTAQWCYPTHSGSKQS